MLFVLPAYCLSRGLAGEFPGFAVFGRDELVCLLVVEGLLLVIVGKTLPCPCGNVADVRVFGAKASVGDGTGCFRIPRLYAIQEIGGVVIMFVICGLVFYCLNLAP